MLEEVSRNQIKRIYESGSFNTVTSTARFQTTETACLHTSGHVV